MAFEGNVEAELIEELRAGGHIALSLVADRQGAIIGHILFSPVLIRTSTDTVEALSLAPMAVLPEQQRHGIGSRLVAEGLTMCRDAGRRIVLVLGHPEFYPRFGFSAELARPLKSPFGEGDAWMAAELVPGALAGVEGRVEYSPPFDRLI